MIHKIVSHYYFKSIITCVLLVVVNISFAQKNKSSLAPPQLYSTDSLHDGLNKVDIQKRRQGLWFQHYDAIRGEPAFMEFGNYQNNQKFGLWYKLDNEGKLKAIENYKQGVLDGESQYYQDGKLVCIGHFRGLNPNNKYDTFWVPNPINDLDSLVIVPSERGSVKHGIWRYYDPQSGQMTTEEEYQIDNLLYTKTFTSKVSQTDSLYNKRMEATMPHIKYPKGQRPKHKLPKYITY